MKGYIHLWRILLKKPIWLKSTPEQKSILITLLLLANHEPNEWEWMGEKFKVMPGQFVTSIESIRKRTGKGISIQNIRSCLKRFEKLEFLTNKATKSGRLITIINWKDYQPDQNKTNKDNNKEVTKTQQRGNKEVTPNNNDKNDKNDKKNKYPAWLDLGLWSEFKKMRVRIKKPMTNHAEQLRINDLKKIIDKGYSQEEIINRSIACSWQDFYEPDKKEIKRKPGEW